MLRTGTSGRFLARRVWNQFLDELFPENRPNCKLCRKPLPEDDARGKFPQERLDSICPFCAQEAEQVKLANLVKAVPLNYENGIMRSSMQQPGRHPVGIRSMPVVCALEYSGFVRTSIRHFKYDGLMELVPWFTSSMLEAARMKHVLPHIDGIVHVPASADRARKRGYDQAYLLAHAVSASTRLPHIPALYRISNAGIFTQSQTAKSRSDRRASLQGKFKCRDSKQIQQKRILLVDDVVTTGATLQTCADLLLASGANSVIGLVVAYVR